MADDRQKPSRAARPSVMLAQLGAALALSSLALLGAAPAQAAWNVFPKGGAQLERKTDQRLFVSLQGGIQTLIVQPSFTGAATDFGMIIPTPAVPDFSNDVDDNFFDQLALMTNEPARTQVDGEFLADGGPPPTSPPPAVVETALVGIYKARVVQANSIDQLTGWLDENDFSYTPEGKAALAYYVANRWFFVALEVNVKNVKAAEKYDGYLQPLVIRYPASSMVLPMKIAYLQDSHNFNWTLYLDTPGQFMPPVYRLDGRDAGPLNVTPVAGYSSASLPDADLAPYASVLSPQVLAGDHLARLSVGLDFSHVKGDLVFNLVTTTQPTANVQPPEGSGCSVVGKSRQTAGGAELGWLALVGLAALSVVRRRRS